MYIISNSTNLVVLVLNTFTNPNEFFKSGHLLVLCVGDSKRKAILGWMNPAKKKNLIDLR